VLPLLADLAPRLRTDRFGRVAEGHEALDSTNRRALEWAEAGAPEGTLVISEHQTAGRGRLGRAWADAPGASLLFSLVLRPDLPPQRMGLIPLAAGVAVAEALALHAAPLEPSLKWPNDVLLGGRKVCGILAEGRLGGASGFAVLGVGVNVGQEAFPGDLADRATSLRQASGRTPDRPALLADLLARLEARYDQVAGGEGSAVLEAFAERMPPPGTPLTVRPSQGGPSVSGTLDGLAEDGALRLRTPEGVVSLHAGEVTTQSVAP
jgi:BirA family transcriptional regulator, biotin operon repressor / biotin---[acetyl-CoA-carboxylase] ligase